MCPSGRKGALHATVCLIRVGTAGSDMDSAGGSMEATHPLRPALNPPRVLEQLPGVSYLICQVGSLEHSSALVSSQSGWKCLGNWPGFTSS